MTLKAPYLCRKYRVVARIALALVLGASFSGTLLAQTADFTANEAGLVGTTACNGGSATAITPLAESTTVNTGSNSDQGYNLVSTACGMQLASIQQASNATDASDTASLDDGVTSGSLTKVSMLGGLLSFDSKSENSACTANASAAISCQATSTGKNLYFNGQHITGTFTQATKFSALGIQVTLGSACPVALVSATLTLDSSSASTVGNHFDAAFASIDLQGTATCVLSLQTMKFDLQDWSGYGGGFAGGFGGSSGSYGGWSGGTVSHW